MQPADRTKFVAILEGLAAVKPGKGLTPEALSLWWRSMQAWTIEEFTTAAEHLSRSEEFMPNPWHFDQLRKASRPTAGEAWIVALDCARNGRSTSGDPLIDRAAKALGGYRAIGMSHTDSTHFLEKRFAEHYVEIRSISEIREELPQITQDKTRTLAPTRPTSAANVLARLSRPNCRVTQQ